MHKIVVVSRCEKKALKNTRHILDNYGIRTSDKSWIIDITDEGLRDLVKNLRITARKNSAIAVYYLKESRMRLYVIVGNKKLFGADGACPISTTTKKHISFDKENHCLNMSVYEKMCEYTGYAHDIGKGGYFFQEILKSNSSGKKENDLFRHEIMTLIFLISKDFTEAQENLKSMFEYKSLKFLKDGKYNYLSREDVLSKVIATHHRIFETKSNTCLLDRHVNLAGNVKNIKKSLQNFKLNKELMNILKAAFVKKAAAEKMLANREIALSNGHYHYFRLSLMLADHYISSLRKEVLLEPDNMRLLAKSKAYGNETLSDHLYSVGKMNAHIIKSFVNIRDKFMCLSYSELSNVTKQSRGAYVWQNSSIKSLAEQLNKNSQGGNFVVLSASTGSGKTQTGLRIAAELNSEIGLRLNVVLGLRTLTLQTAKAYKKALGVSNDYIATLIGSLQTKKLDKAMNEDIADDNDETDNNEEFDVSGGITEDLNVPKYCQTQASTNSKKRMLYTPIVISTIDYLVQAAMWERSKHLLTNTRLMTSDVIIDEIDMYSTEDLKSIMRLAYLIGLFGRNLIITTATAMPAIIDNVFKFYQNGYDEYNKYSGVEKKINVHLLSDYKNMCFDLSANKQDVFKHTLDSYNKDSAVLMQKANNNIHKVRIDSIDTIDDVQALVVSMHDANKITHKNIQTSIGVVRTERISHAYEIVKTLGEKAEALREEGVQLNIIFYHGRLLLAVRAYLEKMLDAALTRKDSANDAYLNSDIFLSAYEKRDANTKDIITIVVTTPVEEVGRDHDFDWAIIEPTSSRSVIQMIGRVNRHRKKEVLDCNVSVLNNTFVSLKDQNKTGYKYEDSNSRPFINEETGYNDFKALYGDIIYDSSASSIISPIEGTLPFFENNTIQNGLENYSLSFPHLSCSITEWRKSDGKTNIYFYSEESDSFFNFDEERNRYTERDVPRLSMNINNRFYYINDNNVNEIIGTVKDKIGIDFNDFEKSYLQGQTQKSENKTKFSVVFGLI